MVLILYSATVIQYLCYNCGAIVAQWVVAFKLEDIWISHLTPSCLLFSVSVYKFERHWVKLSYCEELWGVSMTRKALHKFSLTTIVNIHSEAVIGLRCVQRRAHLKAAGPRLLGTGFKDPCFIGTPQKTTPLTSLHLYFCWTTHSHVSVSLWPNKYHMTKLLSSFSETNGNKMEISIPKFLI